MSSIKPEVINSCKPYSLLLENSIHTSCMRRLGSVIWRGSGSGRGRGGECSGSGSDPWPRVSGDWGRIRGRGSVARLPV